MHSLRTALTFIAISLASVAVRGETNVPLTFTRLDLTDGRKLKNIVVKTYNSKSGRLLIVADGKAMTIAIAAVPSPFNQQLKWAPASGVSVNTFSKPPVTMMDQYGRQDLVAATDQYGRNMILDDATKRKALRNLPVFGK